MCNTHIYTHLSPGTLYYRVCYLPATILDAFKAPAISLQYHFEQTVHLIERVFGYQLLGNQSLVIFFFKSLDCVESGRSF